MSVASVPASPDPSVLPVEDGAVDIDLTDRLLGAAIAEFAEKGLDKAGVAAIARRAGVTTGAIYSRWSGKQDMMVDAVDEVMSHQLATLLTDRTDPSAPEILASMGAELVDPCVDAQADAIMMEAFAAARRDEEFGEMLRRRLADQESRLADVLDEGKAAGIIDPELSTEAIVALCHAIGLGFTLFRSVRRPEPVAADWNTLIERLIGACLVDPTP